MPDDERSIKSQLELCPEGLRCGAYLYTVQGSQVYRSSATGLGPRGKPEPVHCRDLPTGVRELLPLMQLHHRKE